MSVYLVLQSAAFEVKGKYRKAVYDAMNILDTVARDMRHKAIFAAGAKARKPNPRFEKRELGSMEQMTWYDGYASTHKGFENPYRRRY